MDVYHIVMLVMYAICNLDQKAPNLEKVWMNWWIVHQSLEKLVQVKESIVEKEWQVPFTTKQQKMLFKFFYVRWKSVHSPLHTVA